jgi:hypothetical protein
VSIRLPSHHQHRYDADVECVYALLVSPEFLRERRIAAGDVDVAVEVVRHQGGRASVRLTSSVAADLPAFARKLFSRFIRVVDQAEWEPAQDGYLSRWEVEVAGGAGVVRGQQHIASAGRGSVQRDEFEVEVRFPLLRAPLARLMAKEALKAMAAESAFLERALARKQ